MGLVQRMADAQYSFVIHTTNPATGDSGEIYAEVVRGLGEVLVGNYPGRAFSFTGGEDLDGYAGAGLYDSVPMDETEERPVDYSSDPLLTDVAFQQKMMADVLRTGAAIERSLGSPQDIEGCIDSE